MNNPKKLDCWKPSFEIPQFLLDRANDINLANVSDSARTKGEPQTFSWRYPSAIFDVIVAEGYCIWHDDKHYHSRYSGALILRNDPLAWIEVAGQPKIQQPVGYLVSLDIWRKHRLNCPGGIQGKPGVWVGMMRDKKDFQTRQQWEEDFFSLINRCAMVA